MAAVRQEPVGRGAVHAAPADDGVEGNARLTSANATLLTVLLAGEGLTILQIRQLITIHAFLGLLLLAPVALKIATTSYRFARYYLGESAYANRGPPQLLFRVLGPVLVVATVAVLASGVALLTRTPRNAGLLLTAHKASFIVWVALMAVHFVGHIAESLRLMVQDWRPRRSAPELRGRAARRAVVALTLLVGVGIAAALTPSNSWSNEAQQQQHEQR